MQKCKGLMMTKSLCAVKPLHLKPVTATTRPMACQDDKGVTDGSKHAPKRRLAVQLNPRNRSPPLSEPGTLRQKEQHCGLGVPLSVWKALCNQYAWLIGDSLRTQRPYRLSKFDYTWKSHVVTEDSTMWQAGIARIT